MHFMRSDQDEVNVRSTSHSFQSLLITLHSCQGVSSCFPKMNWQILNCHSGYCAFGLKRSQSSSTFRKPSNGKSIQTSRDECKFICDFVLNINGIRITS